MTNFFYYSVKKFEPEKFTFDELVQELQCAANHEERCRDGQHGISSKETVRTRKIEDEIRRRCFGNAELIPGVLELMTRDSR